MAVDKLSDNFQLRMRTLSPIHVGAGKEKWLSRNLDYFIENRKLVVVDAEKFMARLMDSKTDGGLSAYDKFCLLHSKNQDSMDDLMIEFLEETDITLPEITKQKLDYTSNPANVIHTLVRDGFGQPILPGSSVKGAVRSAIFHFLHNPQKRAQYEWNDQSNKLGKPDRDIFGDFTKEQLMTFICPVDVKVPKTVVQNVDVFYVDTNIKKSRIDEGFKNALSLEVVPAGVEMTFELKLASDEWLGEIKKQEDLTKSELERKHHQRREQEQFKPTRFLHKKWGDVLQKGSALPKLFEIINKATHAHLEREIKFYKDFPQSPGIGQIIADLEIWKEKTESSLGSCVLRLGAGSGFHSMTGEWRFDDHSSTIENPDTLNEVPFRSSRKKLPAPYKTRKWAMQSGVYQPLGFVEIFLPGANIEGVEILEVSATTTVEIAAIAEIIQKSEETKPAPKLIELPKSKDFNQIKPIEKDKTFLDAEVVKVLKPFPKVRLLIDNYPFADTFADLTGAKNAPLVEGGAVEVLVRQLTKEGKISNVSLCQH